MAADSTAAGPGGLSEEQAAVYDRQLRVWGSRRSAGSAHRASSSRVSASPLRRARTSRSASAPSSFTTTAPRRWMPRPETSSRGRARRRGNHRRGRPHRRQRHRRDAARDEPLRRDLHPPGTERSVGDRRGGGEGIRRGARHRCSLAIAERINDACRDAGASFFYGECRATVANFSPTGQTGYAVEQRRSNTAEKDERG